MSSHNEDQDKTKKNIGFEFKQDYLVQPTGRAERTCMYAYSSWVSIVLFNHFYLLIGWNRLHSILFSSAAISTDINWATMATTLVAIILQLI